MRVITANLNGIRSAARKGFFNWLRAQNADVICVQELKAQIPDLIIPTCILKDMKRTFIARKRKAIAALEFTQGISRKQ